MASAWSAAAVETNLVLESAKIDDTSLGDALWNGSRFGLDVAGVGDVNGDGVPDIAVGARQGEGSNKGSFWLIFLDADGNEVPPSPLKFADTANDPLNLLQLEADADGSGTDHGSFFGDGLTLLPDFDGDAIDELKFAVGASGGDPGAAPQNSGAVYLVDVDKASWTISGVVTIASGTQNFTTLAAQDRSGFRVRNLGDWDGDGAPEIAFGAPLDNDGVPDNGAFYIVYLKPDGTGVKTYVKISATQGGFDGSLDADASSFGSSVVPIGDLDGDEQVDLAVGAPLEGAGGAAFVLFMDPGCQVNTTTVPHPSCIVKPGAVKITAGSAGFAGPLQSGGAFGDSVAWLLGTGGRLVVGASLADSTKGEIWILTLASNGMVIGQQRIASGANWNVTLPAETSGPRLGAAVDALGDLNGDLVEDLVVGAFEQDSPGALNTGAAYLLVLDPCPRVIASPIAFDSPNDDGVNLCVPTSLPASGAHTLHLYVESGRTPTANPANVCVEKLGEGAEMCAWDLRVTLEGGAAITGFAANAPSGTPPPDRGAVAPPLDMDWEIVSPTEFRANWIGPGSPSNPLAGPVKIGDLLVVSDGSGVPALRLAAKSYAVGADLGLQRIPERALALPEPDAKAALVASLGLLAALSRRRVRRAGAALAVLLALATAGSPAQSIEVSVEAQVNITENLNGFTTVLSPGAEFAASVAEIGDIDDDGVVDLAVGARDDFGGPSRMYLLFMRKDGRVRGFSRFEGPMAGADVHFGVSVAKLGDMDGNGVSDVAIGADEVNISMGSVTLLYLDRAGREINRVLIDENDPHLGSLEAGDAFGISLASLGDVDGDGTLELAVGAYLDDDAGSNAGTVWILSLQPGGGVIAADRLFPLPGSLDAGDGFGRAVANLGDLDGPGPSTLALAVGAERDDDGATDDGAVYVLFLDDNLNVLSQQKLSSTQGNLPFSSATLLRFGSAIAWSGDVTGTGGGVLYVGNPYTGASSQDRVFAIHIGPDALARRSYLIARNNGTGFTTPVFIDEDGFGTGIAVLPDLDGDEDPDLAVGAPESGLQGNSGIGALFVLFLKDSDHDGLDQNLDNCPDSPGSHNPLQEDSDGDGVGDVCDNCVDVANADQLDSDADGEGNACEPVELVLQTTGTPAAPSWDLSLQCGSYSVTNVAGAIVLPAGATNPKLLSLTGSSIGSSSISGPGLVSPPGVRSDAIYFQATGNGAPDGRLCTALQAPVSLGTLTTGAIGGTQLAAASLSAEGVGAPGFGLAFAETAGGPVPVTDVRLVNGPPLPILDLELGPAVQTASGTRWEVRAVRSNAEFHRVAFGLIAPAGTTTSEMRWLGCDTTPSGSARLCCEAPSCGDFDGLGVGTNVNPNRAFTVGPQAGPPGTQLPDTMYVVLEGSALSSGSLDTLNPVTEGQYHVLGEFELSNAPTLQPALTHDGVNDITAPPSLGGGTVVPLLDASGTPRSLDQVKLIGAFNPSDDVDGDGIQDLGDNCPFAPNAAQTNRGAFLDATDDSDAFGDACQCGESSDDGAVLDPDDFDQIRDYLAGRVTNPVIAQEIEQRCSVTGTTECNIRDLVFLKQALDTAAPNVETRCDAALSPANSP